MQKIISLSLMLMFLLVSNVSFASVGVRLNGTPIGTATDINFTCLSGTTSVPTPDGSIYNIGCSSSLASTGVANGGAVSMASTDVAVSPSYSFVRKVITSNGDAAFTAGTLANGIPGQIVTIFISGMTPSGATSGGNYTLSPTTTTGFSSIKFTAVKDFAQLLYVNDTVGWVILNYGGTITVTLKG